MRKIVEYTVVPAHLVGQWIEQGWQPLGGVASDSTGLRQAVVKYEDTAPAVQKGKENGAV